MKIAWVMTGAGYRYIVDLIPGHTTIGIGKLSGYEGPVPVIVLSYRVLELQTFLPVARYMNEFNLVPEVHIWRRMTKAPELRVAFRIPNATRELLSGMGANDMLRLFDDAGDREICDLIIGSAGNGEGEATRTFMRLFQKTGVAAVILNEDEDAPDTGFWQEMGPEIVRFVVQTIGTTEPAALEFT